MILTKEQTGELRKELSRVFKGTGFKFSVKKTHDKSLSVGILTAPLNLVKDLKDDTISSNMRYDKVTRKDEGYSNEEMQQCKEDYVKTFCDKGYSVYNSYKGGSKTARALKLIDKVIEKVLPSKIITVDGDYGNIPNYYKDVTYGKDYKSKIEIIEEIEESTLKNVENLI